MVLESTPSVHDLIARRWSPYGFSERPVKRDDLLSLLEAARRAPSSYNEQPWSFIVATQADSTSFERLASCLVEGNQSWARKAPVLVLTVAKARFARNDKPNTAAQHDIGLAVAQLTFEATARGLAVHQMIGILPDRARELYEIPTGFDPLTGIAIGYAEEPEKLDDEMKKRDSARRPRKALSEFVFGDGWGKTSELVG